MPRPQGGGPDPAKCGLKDARLPCSDEGSRGEKVMRAVRPELARPELGGTCSGQLDGRLARPLSRFPFGTEPERRGRAVVVTSHDQGHSHGAELTVRIIGGTFQGCDR